MAKKQTRRSISVSRATYERLKAFCETNSISMSQFVETRVGDFLSEPGAPAPAPTSAPVRPVASVASTASAPAAPKATPAPRPVAPVAAAPAPRPAVPMTSAAARFAVEPPPPIIKPKAETAAPKPAEKRPDQIFTF
jgi:hypothetical protein